MFSVSAIRVMLPLNIFLTNYMSKIFKNMYFVKYRYNI